MTDLRIALPNPLTDESAESMAVQASVVSAFDSIAAEIVELKRPVRSSSRLRLSRRLALGIAALAAIAVVATLTLQPSGRTSAAFAAEDIGWAHSTPLTLLRSGDATVAHLQQYPSPAHAANQSGNMDFSGLPDVFPDGVMLAWAPQSNFDRNVRNAGQQASELRGLDVDGAPARTFHMQFNGPDGKQTSYRSVWVQGGFSLTLSGDAAGDLESTQDDWSGLLDNLEVVSPQTWLSSLPATYLLPSQIASNAKELLDGAPQAPGTDALESIKNLASTTRDSLALRLFAAVECRWVTVWVAARNANDAAGMAEVERATRGFESWKLSQNPVDPADGDGSGGPKTVAGVAGVFLRMVQDGGRYQLPSGEWHDMRETWGNGNSGICAKGK